MIRVYIATSKGQVYPVPNEAYGPIPVINPAGKITGTAFIGGKEEILDGRKRIESYEEITWSIEEIINKYKK